MVIKTIHIKNDDIPKSKALAKELFDHTLKNDPQFHFFFEPALIIRITTEDSLVKVKSFLQAGNIIFEEYDYPDAPEGKFGEERGGFVANNLELFLLIFHANSVAALTMREEEHLNYVERLIHTAFNPGGYCRTQEGEKLKQLAELKLGQKLSQSND